MRSAQFTRLLAIAILLLAIPAASFAGVFLSITVAPPPLPVYVQPPCPQEGNMWTPGYWAWSDDGYYWVPGTWVPAPEVGLLWTPGYWGWSDGFFRWNDGYWGPHVGFYGGVAYGFGYGGMGFYGGEWRGGGFFYNSAVMNVGSTHITNVYVNRTVIVNNNVHVSYNGGAGGINRTPTAAEQQVSREHHVQPTSLQKQHESTASLNPQLLAKNNGGKPSIAATAKPGDFSHGAVPAKAAGGRVNPAALNASAKAMSAAPNKGASTPPRPAAAPASHNVPRPPAANAKPSSPSPSRQPAPRAEPRSAPARTESARPSAPPAHAQSQPAHPSAPAHSSAPPPRSAPPQHSSAPPRQEKAPPKENEKERK